MESPHPHQRALDGAPCRAEHLCGPCSNLADAPRDEPPHAGLIHTRNRKEEVGGALIEMEHYECMQCPACWSRPILDGLKWRLVERPRSH